MLGFRSDSAMEPQELLAIVARGDEIPVVGSSVRDIDFHYFRDFFKLRFDQDFEEQNLSLEQVLANMRLLTKGQLTVAGMLLFGRNSHAFLPIFQVKAISCLGNDIHAEHYLDSEDIGGRLERQFERSVGFIMRHLRKEQRGQSINSLGIPEIPRIVLEELLANALLHRDYFISAPIRVFVFGNRIEIISPGHLPNSLTIANIRSGNSNIRNPILTSYATRVLPYRGLGTGIVRALKEYPGIEFDDDREGNQFRVVIHRHS